MRLAVLLVSLLLSISYATPTNPCTAYQNLQQQCNECSSQKTCSTKDRVYCAQLHHYRKQCHYYTKSLNAAKNNPPTNEPSTKSSGGNKINTPGTNLQDSFDSGTPDSLQNKLHLYNSDITNSKPMPEVVAPKPKMPEGTPTKTPSATDNILKSWY